MGTIPVTGLGEAKGEGYKPVDTGKYQTRITSVEEVETGPNSKNPGSPMLKIKHTIINHDEYSDRPLTHFLLIPTAETEESQAKIQADKIKRLCNACGVETEGDSFDTQDLMGAECTLVVTVTERDNQKQNDVKDFLPLS